MAKIKSSLTVKLPAEFKAVTGWDRVCLVDPSTLDSNPRNWKIHPRSQLDSVMAAIKRVRWVTFPLYNETTGRLIDGNGRKEEAVRKGLNPIPVAIGRWSEEEENFILHSMDSVGSMYRIDAERLKSLSELVSKQSARIKGLNDEHKKSLAKLQAGAVRLADGILSGSREAVPLKLNLSPPRKTKDAEVDEEVEQTDMDEESSDLTSTVAVKETVAVDDVLFPSSNWWGIPDLLTDENLLLTPDMVPDRTYDRSVESVSEKSWYCITTQGWKERVETGIMGGVMGTFCEDYHFEGYYDSAASYVEELKSFDFTAYMVPDFSTYDSWPFPMRLWNLYRSRWVGRYWQEHGMRVLPILQTVISNSACQITDVGLFTLSKNLPVVACQCRTIKQNGGKFESFGKWLASYVKSHAPETVIIYGGGEHRSKFEGYLPTKVKVGKVNRSVHYVYLHSYMDRRRVKIKKGR